MGKAIDKLIFWEIDLYWLFDICTFWPVNFRQAGFWWAGEESLMTPRFLVNAQTLFVKMPPEDFLVQNTADFYGQLRYPQAILASSSLFMYRNL